MISVNSKILKVARIWLGADADSDLAEEGCILFYLLS